jgi:NADH:ubiquinone oxidoreductase subunit E
VNIKKHLLLCATPTKQKCFKGNEGQKTWECLKKTLKKFENDPSTKNVHLLRSKADCLRICKNGPILLVWPDGIWYEKVSPEKYLPGSKVPPVAAVSPVVGLSEKLS